MQNFAKPCILYFTLQMAMLVLRPQKCGDKDTQLDSEIMTVPWGVLKRDTKPLKKKFHRETLCPSMVARDAEPRGLDYVFL